MKKKVIKKKEVGFILTQEQGKAIETVEDLGTASMRAGVQFLLAIEEILVDDFHLKDDDIKYLERKLDRMLKTLYNLKLKGLSILTDKDMEIVGKLAERWLLEERARKVGLLEKGDLQHVESIK